MNNSFMKHIISIAVLAAVTVGCLLIFKNVVVPNHKNGADTEDILINTEDKDTSKDTEKESEPAGSLPEDSSAEDTSDDEDDTYNEDDVKILKESADGGDDYLSKITIIGDGTTYAMKNADISFPNAEVRIWSMPENISPAKIYSISNFPDPYTGEMMNFISAFKAHPTAYVILSFGSYSGSEDKITKNAMLGGMQEFISNLHMLRPSPQVIIQSILPVSEDCEVITPEEVIKRNRWLKELCGANGQFPQGYYLDTYSCLADSNGILRSEYADEDGYHLNDEGYKAVVEYIRHHVHPDFLN